MSQPGSQFFERPIFQILRLRIGIEPEGYAQHYIAFFPLMFEKGIAISEPAFRGRESAGLARQCVETFHRMDEVAGFRSVRSDILHCRRPDIARDSSHVLQSAQPLGHAPVHKIVPDFSGPGNYKHMLRIFLVTGYALDLGMQYKSVVLSDEQQIAAAAQMQHFVVDKYIGARKLQKFLLRRVFGIVSCFGRYAEGGQRRQVFVFGYIHRFSLESRSLIKNRYDPSEYVQTSSN